MWFIFFTAFTFQKQVSPHNKIKKNSVEKTFILRINVYNEKCE